MELPPITDDVMRQMLAVAREYSFVLLKRTSAPASPNDRAILWEHGRRNFQLRAVGLLSIVGPLTDGGEAAGIGIFNASVERTREIMDGDPGVQAGLFTYEVHPCRSFPGDALPSE